MSIKPGQSRLGTAVFDIVATPASGPAAHLSLEKDKPAIIKVTKHFLKQAITAPTYSDTWLKEVRLWADDTGGTRRFRYRGMASRIATTIYPDYNYITDYAWSDTNAAGIAITTFGSGGSVTGAISSGLVMSAPDQQLDHEESDIHGTTAFYVYHYYAKGVRHEWPSEYGSTVETLAARTEQTLFTGGKSAVGGQTLFCLSAYAVAYGKPQGIAWYYTPATAVTNGLSNMGRPLDGEGKLWCLVADNAKTIITTEAGGKEHVRVDAGKQAVRLKLKSVTFSGVASGEYHDVLCDTNGAAYAGAHWETNFSTRKVTSHPALYVSGSKLRATVKFAVEFAEADTAIVVVGTSGAHVFHGSASLTLGATELEVTATTTAPLAADKVDFFDPLKINWAWAGTNNLPNFSAAGSSENQVYVTWHEPQYPELLYHTAVHLACSQTGGTDLDSVFANTWLSFAGPANITTWDGKPLYYYKAGLPFASTTTGFGTLLSNTNHNGQCGAMATLLEAALWVNRQNSWSLAAIAPPSGTDYLVVKEWTFGTTNTGDSIFKWEDELTKNAEGNPEMVPLSGVTGPVSPAGGVAGQNSPTPAEKIFTSHSVIKNTRDNKYYDPSYGKVYTGAADFQAQAIAGYAKSVLGSTNPATMKVQICQTNSTVGLPPITP